MRGISRISESTRTGGLVGFRFQRSVKLFPGVRLNVRGPGVRQGCHAPGAWTRLRFPDTLSLQLRDGKSQRALVRERSDGTQRRYLDCIERELFIEIVERNRLEIEYPADR